MVRPARRRARARASASPSAAGASRSIDGGTQRLPRIVGLGRALDLILTGRMVEAAEALRWGLLTEVVEPGRHLERALEIAEGLARFPQETMLADRRAALAALGLPLDEGLALEAAGRPRGLRRRRRAARAASPGARAAGRRARAYRLPSRLAQRRRGDP